MTEPEIVYKIALSMVRHITPEIVKSLPERGLSPEDFFTLDTAPLSTALGLAPGKGFDRMTRDEALFKAREEYGHITKHGLRTLFLLDDDYPVRLFEVPDPPVCLYLLGEADLDTRHIISVVGTRKPTSYGIDFTARLVSDLAVYFPDLTVVSGLAYGIDAAAHKAALDAGRPTVAVVAHGLNMIYPAPHRELARDILRHGGAIVSEYPFGTAPYRQRFLERNRIVAALADVTTVIESDIKGGAMSTANTAFSYSREVMALPGRVTDKLSSGCNHLIRKQKAHILTGAPDVMEQTGWQPFDLPVDTSKRNLFPELEGEPKLVYDTLQFSSDPLVIDRLHMLTMIPVNRLMAVLGEMEFDGIVIRHPGNRYSLA